jgi:hypothetical protein
MPAAVRSAVAVGSAVLVVGVGAVPAQAVNETSVGRRFNDGLDTRYSVQSFTSAAGSMGYAATGYQNGRSATNTFTDGKSAGVLALFGHANAGIFLTDEGATDAEDQILAAGRVTDVVSPTPNVLRYVTEYLPLLDVDDMRLMILAGCDTSVANDSWGDFLQAASSRGVDSVIGFSDLVYYPGTTPSTPVGNTNYSGNYFWSRFAAYVKTGVSVATAMSRARTDLVAKEGDADGWDRYVIGGAASNPGAVTLTPVSPGGPAPTAGTAPTARTIRPTRAYGGVNELTPTGRATAVGADGARVTNVTTAEGVSYRLRADGSLLDLSAVASRTGEITLSPAQARARAESFARRSVPGFSPATWTRVDERTVRHGAGEALLLTRWRSVAAGHPGAREVTVEVDQRTGAITYSSATAGSAKEAGFALTADDAIRIARTHVAGGDIVDAGAAADTWQRSSWVVTLVHQPLGAAGARLPHVERIRIDARDGALLSRTTT